MADSRPQSFVSVHCAQGAHKEMMPTPTMDDDGGDDDGNDDSLSRLRFYTTTRAGAVPVCDGRKRGLSLYVMARAAACVD